MRDLAGDSEAAPQLDSATEALGLTDGDLIRIPHEFRAQFVVCEVARGGGVWDDVGFWQGGRRWTCASVRRVTWIG
jgi:hypothetical protein